MRGVREGNVEEFYREGAGAAKQDHPADGALRVRPRVFCTSAVRLFHACGVEIESPADCVTS